MHLTNNELKRRKKIARLLANVSKTHRVLLPKFVKCIIPLFLVVGYIEIQNVFFAGLALTFANEKNSEAETPSRSDNADALHHAGRD